jgi:hypothetical protein
MFGRANREQQLVIDYWLPITKVNITGTVVSATRAHGDETEHSRTTSTATPAVVSVVTRPDYSQPCRLKVPAGAWLERHAKLGLLQDGRLVSADTSAQDDRGEAFKGILTFAAMGAGIGAAVGGPIGAAVGGGAALLVAGAVLETSNVRGERSSQPDQGSADLIDSESIDAGLTLRRNYKKLGIAAGYVIAQRSEAQLLADLRVGEARVRLAFTAAAANAADDTSVQLKVQSHRLKLIRAELARSEELYQKWLDKQVTTKSDAYDEELEIGDLPSPAEAQAWFDDESLSKRVKPFHDACVALGVVISRELINVRTISDNEEAMSSQAGSAGESSIHYRVLRPAILRVFRARKYHHHMEELSTQRILVAMHGYERTIPILEGGAKQSLSLAFDTTGALTSISSDITSGAANAASELGGVPSALKEAFDAGTDIAAPFTASGRAKALQDQLSEINARAALSPTPDPLQKLKDQLAQAELQARLKVAGRLASGEASNAVVILGSTAHESGE